MNSIKFICFFLLNLIKRNIIKSIFVFVCIVSFIYAGTFEPVRNEIIVLQDIKLDSLQKEYLYLYSYLKNNKIVYNVLQLNEPAKLVDGKYIYYSYNEFNKLMWILFVVSLTLIIIGTLIGTKDKDVGWEVEESYIYAISRFLICEEENGKYYYILFGKLVFVSDDLLNKGYMGLTTSESIIRGLCINSLSDLSAYPNFKTKKEKRDWLLSKLGV
jgi:hypothetical protein